MPAAGRTLGLGRRPFPISEEAIGKRNKNTMNKTIITAIMVIIVGAGSFYGGIKYDQSAALASGQNTGANGTPRQGGGAGGRRGMGANGGFSGGEIIAKDATSITIKLRDNPMANGQQVGGSKIIFISDSTQVMKAVAGSLKDLTIGQNVSAMGTPNADGSISAESIQIRPASAPLQRGEPASTTPSPAPTPAQPTSAVKEFTVDGKNFSFSPSTLTIKKGDTVKITFKNTGGTHDFVIDEFNARTQRIGTGAQETIQFIADKTGSFEYYCSVSSHRAMGMKGTLIVQ